MSAPSQKITFAEMRDSDVRGLLIHYADCHDCDQRTEAPAFLLLRGSHVLSGLRLSRHTDSGPASAAMTPLRPDLCQRFSCIACATPLLGLS